MPIESIHLGKLLKLMYLPARQQQAALRAEMRTELSKDADEDSGGGDFHVPFWADVKRFVAGEADLNEQSRSRVAKNPARRRLYPQLTKGFLQWWNEKRRWSNEPDQPFSERIHGRYPIPQLNCTVKIENVLGIKVGETPTGLYIHISPRTRR